MLSAYEIILLVVELGCSLRYFLFTLPFNSIRALESSNMKMGDYAIILCCLALLPCTFWVKLVCSERIFLAIRFAATAFGLFLILFQYISLASSKSQLISVPLSHHPHKESLYQGHSSICSSQPKCPP